MFFQALSIDEKKTMTRLLEDTIKRTVVRCSFRLSDNQENTNSTTLQNSSPIGSHPDVTKTVRSMIDVRWIENNRSFSIHR